MSSNEMKKWNCDDSKVGDKVFIVAGGWGRFMEVAAIEKISKLHVTVRGNKYRINGGSRAGDNWGSTSIKKYDDAEWNDYLQERRDIQMRNALRNHNWDDKEVVRKVHAIVFPDPVGA